MVSVGVSALGRTEIHFIEPEVKINGAYYRDCLLLEKLLPDIREYSDYYTFQQDGAPAHRARETVELLTKETPDFIPPNLWPPNSPDLNPVDDKIWGLMQEKVYRTKIRDIEELRARIVNAWDEFDSWLSMMLLASGALVLKLVLRPKADTLSTPCSLILFKYKN